MAKRGRKFVFHGGFKSKRAARRKERTLPGAFILDRMGRFFVLTKRRK